MICGEKVRLRAYERTDLPKTVAWLNDPEVHAGLGFFLPFSSVEEENWFDKMIESPPAEHSYVIEILENDQWTPAGSCGYCDFQWRVRSAEVGIFIGEKRLWNRGYGTEVMRLLLRHGFNTLNLNRIYLHVFSTNPRAIRSYEKVGFVHEGRFRQAEFRNGAYIDVLIMSVLRSEWQE